MNPQGSPHDGLRRRIAYADAGVIMRDTLERAHRLGLGSLQLRVLNAVLAATVSYSKDTDATTTRNLAAFALGIDLEDVRGFQRDRVADALNKLEAHGLVTVTRTGKGRGSRLIVSVRSETPLAGVGVSGVENDPTREETPTATARNTHSHRAETPTVSGAHLEGLEVNPRPRRTHTKLEELADRVCDHFEARGARAPRDEVERVLERALGLHDWRLVDSKIGQALERAQSWPYVRTALEGLAQGVA